MPPDTPATATTTPAVADGPLGPSVDLLVSVRRAVELSQPVFRALVDAVSNPGRSVPLPEGPEGLHPVVLPVLTVVDLQTVLAVVDTDANSARDLAGAIGRVTGASVGADHRDADIVLVTDPDAFTPDLVWTLRTGTAMSPELGAKVFVACSAIDTYGHGDESPAPAPPALVVSGPGAADGRRIVIGGVDPAALDVVDRVNGAYPAGIDIFMVDSTGRVVGLPRSNRLDTRTAETRGDR